jgi:hypothetical protein
MTDPPPPPNDPTIPDDELLYHRVYPDPQGIYIEPSSQQPRPTSGAFRSKDHEPLSVDLASLSTPQESLSRAPRPDFYVAEVNAGDIRKLDIGCGVVRDPEEGNPAHALVHGRGKGGALTKGQREKMAQRSRFTIVDQEAIDRARERSLSQEQ